MRTVLAACAVAVAMTGCTQDKLSPEAERGRQVYLAHCTACHATDPARPGPVGPPIKGSPRQLLEAKVLHGTYPLGYQPQRPTAVMPPQPQLAGDIPALAAYLK